MYSITPTLSNNYSSTQSLNALLDDIDSKIVDIATVQLSNVKYGFDKEVAIERYEDLIIYKDILLDKLLGCNCLDDEYIVYIITKIKQLINT